MGWLEDLLNQNQEPNMSMASLSPMSMPGQQENIPMGGSPDRPVSPLDTLPEMEVSKKAPMPSRMPAIETNVPAPAEMNPVVKEYLQNKMDTSKFSDEARQELVSKQKEDGEGYNWQALGAGIAGAFQDYGRGGNSAMNNVNSVMGRKDKANEKALSEFDKGKIAEKEAFEKDPDSQESQMAREIAAKMGMSPDMVKGLSAARFKELSPVFGKIMDVENQKLNRDEARAERREDRSIRMDQNNILRQERKDTRQDAIDLKRQEKEDSLTTPFGLANTADDAKKIKEGYESKQSFDAKIDQMIALREKHGGGAVMNREDVARGKQLSKDALLAYKNMAKLGVLSKADEDIINAIIPADPLAYDFIPGQDPIMKKLTEFKKDSNRDFETQIGTRVKSRNEVAAPGGGIDMKVDNFMKKNGIKDKAEAMEILKRAGKI